MKKIATLLAAVLVMTVAFAGCSSTETGSSSTGTSSTSSESSVSSEATASQESSSESEASAAETGDYGEFTTIEEGKLIMSTNAQFPPYEMVADGEGFNGTGFEGIDVEIAAAIAEKLGLELQIDDMDFTAALEAVQAGMSDMAMAGITVNEERLAVMDFSDTYATGVQVVIVKEGSDVTLDNLGEQLIGVQNGTTGWQFCSDDFGDDHVAAFDNGITAVQALVNDQVDCVVIDQGPAEVFVSENPGLTILETEYAIEDYAIGVNKGNTALLDAINGALAELQGTAPSSPSSTNISALNNFGTYPAKGAALAALFAMNRHQGGKRYGSVPAV